MPKKTKSYATNERTPLTRVSKAAKTLTITSEDDESFTIPIPNEYEVEVLSDFTLQTIEIELSGRLLSQPTKQLRR